MGRRIHRHEVAIGRVVTFELTGDPLHVAARAIGAGDRAPHRVDFWTEDIDGARRYERAFQVFGTGHELPDGAAYWGSTQRTPEGLVWHLYELAEGG